MEGEVIEEMGAEGGRIDGMLLPLKTKEWATSQRMKQPLEAGESRTLGMMFMETFSQETHSGAPDPTCLPLLEKVPEILKILLQTLASSGGFPRRN